MVQRRMAKMEPVTEIGATRERCFDLSGDIDLHLQSMAESGERAVAGKTTGLIGLGGGCVGGPPFWRDAPAHVGIEKPAAAASGQRVTTVQKPRGPAFQIR